MPKVRKSRIKIEDLPKNRRISKKDMRKVKGGAMIIDNYLRNQLQESYKNIFDCGIGTTY